MKSENTDRKSKTLDSSAVVSFSTLKELTLKNVRCFKDEQSFNIRPLTFLVGENSTGKTTALNSIHAILSSLMTVLYNATLAVNFNESPYQMGSFRDIVTKTKPQTDQIKISFCLEHEGKEIKLCIVMEENKNSSGVDIDEITLDFVDRDKYKLVFRKNLNEANRNLSYTIFDSIERVKIDDANNLFEIPLDQFALLSNPSSKDFIERTIVSYLESSEKHINKYIKFLKNHSHLISDVIGKIYFPLSIAPIRSQPKRTYDMLSNFYSTEGSDIPSVLKILKESEPNKWKILREKLIKFGRKSKLFSDIDVETFGSADSTDNKLNNPFRLRVEINKYQSNLVDVGYGVGQILPILTRLFLSQNDEIYRKYLFLTQQPEIHLHPKAQAALCSAFVEACEKDNFIIETHSDYMLKRARIEIRNENIKPEDVSLIYLESTNDGTKVHNITFDKEANMTGVPEGYGKFFIEELNRELGLN